jgi:hypothetical protein
MTKHEGGSVKSSSVKEMSGVAEFKEEAEEEEVKGGSIKKKARKN